MRGVKLRGLRQPRAVFALLEPSMLCGMLCDLTFDHAEVTCCHILLISGMV